LQAEQQEVVETVAAAPVLSGLPEWPVTPDIPLGFASDQDGPGASPAASVTAYLGNDDDVCQDHEPEEIVHVSIVIWGFG
jgi:hypothetical protein